MKKGVQFSITASDKSKTVLNGLNNNLKQVQTTQRSWNKGLSENRRAVQQLGFQVSDFAVQVSGGQSAMLAFTQQGGQMLQFFGPMGAIAAALLAVFGSLAIAFSKSGSALIELKPVLGSLSQTLTAVGKVLTYLKELFFDLVNVILNNVDLIVISLGFLASFMVGKMVISFIATSKAAAILGLVLTGKLSGAFALASTGSGVLARSLVSLRGAILGVHMTSILAGGGVRGFAAAIIFLGKTMVTTLAKSPLVWIVVIGYLINIFVKLSRATGSFSEAIKLMGGVVLDIFKRIGTAFKFLGAGVALMYAKLGKYILGWVNDYVQLWGKYVNTIIGAFNGIKAVITLVWSTMWDGIKNLGADAMNWIIDMFEDSMNSIVQPMNDFYAWVGASKRLKPIDLSEWRQEIDETNLTVGDLQKAFTDAKNNTDFGLNWNLDGAVAGADKIIKVLQDDVKVLWKELSKPLPNLEKIKTLLASLEGQEFDINNILGKGDVEDIEAKAKNMKSVFEDVAGSVAKSVGTAFDGLLDKTKSLSDTVNDMLSSILKKMRDALLNPVFKVLGNAITGAVLGTPNDKGIFEGGFFSDGMNAVQGLETFAGGGTTGKGARQGGLDGRGGMLAMVHPNEQINDLTRHQGGEGTTLVVNIHENASEGEHRVEQSGGRVDVFLKKAIVNTLGSGEADGAMKNRFGLHPRAMGG